MCWEVQLLYFVYHYDLPGVSLIVNAVQASGKTGYLFVHAVVALFLTALF